MPRPTLAILIALLAVALVFLHRQSRTQVRLQQDLDRLQREHLALDRLRRENENLAATQASIAAPGLPLPDPRELDGLRAKVADLDRRLQWQLRMNAGLGPPKPLAPGMTPINQLTDAGAATPTAAAQSFFWAVAQADPDTLARQLEFTDDARAKAQALFAALSETSRQEVGSPEKMMAIYFSTLYGRATGYQLAASRYNPQSADSGEWQVALQTASGSQHDVSFPVHRTAGGWHEVIGVSWFEDWTRLWR